VGNGGRARCEWGDFADLSAAALYDLLRFRQAIFVVEQSSPFPDLDGLDRCAHHLLLTMNGALVGCARVIPDPQKRRVAIGRVAVGPDWRRRGLGRRIVQEALARCRRDYPGWPIAVSAQTYLAPFYESLGFAATSLPYDDYGVPHVDMIRPPERRQDA
jgi:ElaA protein